MRLFSFARVLPLLFAALLSVGPAPCADVTPAAKPPAGVGLSRFTDIFSPLRTDQAALSPDGRYLAFSWHDGRELSVVVVAIENPKVAQTKVVVANDPAGTKRNTRPDEYPLAQVRFLRWSSPTRVVLQTNTPAVFGVGLHQVQMRGVWFAFDFNGENARILFDPRDVTIPVGGAASTLVVPVPLQAVEVDPELPDGVLLRRTEWDTSNRAKPVSKEIWYRADARTGDVRELAEAHRVKRRDALDARRARFAPELRSAAAELAEVLPNKVLDVLECDDEAKRFVARVQGGADAGAFHVFDRPTRKSFEMIRRAEHLDTGRTASSIPFEFPAPEGPPLRGVLTLPRQARLRPFPAIVFCPAKLNDKNLNRFRPEILAFADMGLAVIQLEGAGARVTDRGALQAITPEQTSARIVAAIDAIAVAHPVSAKRIALYGEAQGGLLALRTLHLHRDRFRAAVAMEPALGSDSWRDDQLLAAASAGQPPIQLLSYPGPTHRSSGYRNARQLASQIQRRGGSAELYALTADDLTAVPRARAATFREIETFLNLSLYDYTVELGDLTEVPE